MLSTLNLGKPDLGKTPPHLAHLVHVHPPKTPTSPAQEAPEASSFRARPVGTSRRVPRRVSQQQPFPRGPVAGAWGIRQENRSHLEEICNDLQDVLEEEDK
ncbi:Hypothetical predicted protein [Marmota monax]|uniref:Uncharacterized protein n=1 Tax=Marmota monax TaxID=9995 RepID=A0A5E4C5U2_MARMO|nr:hypothetical protein GHT09_001888 [Marmota monax]VTJ77317.1 Hypothetical predicted protein [Marmota monax]